MTQRARLILHARLYRFQTPARVMTGDCPNWCGFITTRLQHVLAKKFISAGNLNTCLAIQKSSLKAIETLCTSTYSAVQK